VREFSTAFYTLNRILMRFGFEPLAAQDSPQWLRPFVDRDQEVAVLGDTGLPDSPHLHFGASNVLSGHPELVPFQSHLAITGSSMAIIGCMFHEVFQNAVRS
jgi:hypothetical protein